MTLAHDRQALDRFGSLDPATGEVIATWPVDDEASVREAVDRARVAAQWWADLGYGGRRERLLAWKGVLTRRMRQLAQLVHRENGKPVDDALLEIILTIEHASSHVSSAWLSWCRSCFSGRAPCGPACSR